MATLYEIDRQILECCDPETGEIIDFEALGALTMEREEKLEGIACFIKNLDAEAKAIREEEKALAARRKANENKAKSLREYLSYALAGQAFKTPRVSVSFRSSTFCEVADETVVLGWLQANNRDDCIKYAAPELKRDEITRLLKDGVEIPGAALGQRQNMQLK